MISRMRAFDLRAASESFRGGDRRSVASHTATLVIS
jgi:hypothetical protein